MARDAITKKLLGRNVAAFHLARERVLQLPWEDRRRVVTSAIRALAEDDLAKRSDDVFDEARRILVILLKK